MDEPQPRAELDPRHLEALRERIAESPFHGWAGMELVRVGLALRSILAPGNTHRTAQLGVHFLAKGEGTRLIGRGRALHLGTRMGYGEAEVLDGDQQLLARATATFIVLPAPGAF